MITQETTLKGKMGRLQRLQARLTSNRAELGHLEASLARFEAMIAQIADAADRQAFYTAAKQEASQQLQAALVEGERMATVLQMSVRQHYGIRSEKLADFGIKPFRGRNRKGSSEEKPQPPAAGPEPEPAGTVGS